MNNPLVPALRDIEILFRPFRHRKLQLNGRVVLAAKPLSMAHKGVPSVQMEQFYQQRASHDLALIITEPLAIDDAAAAATNDDAVFCGGRALRVWKSICRTIHANGCKIAPLRQSINPAHWSIRHIAPHPATMWRVYDETTY